MDYLVKQTFMADGKTYPRGSIVKGKVVANWLNGQILEDQGYLRRVESKE
jgi:hypothetical protein